MDKHTLGEILKILPDDFTFKAVLDEDSQSICFETQDKPHNMKQEVESIKQDSTQTPLSQEAMLESKAQEAEAEEQELWEDMCALPNWCIEEKTQYYDIKSKRWIDYTTYWSNRIKTELESKGIFMSDTEFMELTEPSHDFYLFELDDFIDKHKTYEKAPDDFEGCTLTCSPYPQDK